MANTTEPELIAKKEVLEQTGISYGQFYRWKRKGLIPESWFIRKSTFTGQETFLPKEKILERIELIKELKESYSLEEIAELLSQEPSKRRFEVEELRRGGWISEEVLERYRALTGRAGPYRFWEVFQLAVFERLYQSEAEPEAIELALTTLQGDRLDLDDEGLEWTLWLLSKDPGASFCCLAPERYVRFDPKAQIIARLDLNGILEAVKMELREK